MFFAGEKRVKEGAAEVSPRRFRHEGTKTLRNTKWECFCGDGRRGEKSKGGYAEMIFFCGKVLPRVSIVLVRVVLVSVPTNQIKFNVSFCWNRNPNL